MRTRILLVTAIFAALSVGFSAVPATASGKKVDKGVLKVPNEQAFKVADVICPDGGPANGISYAWIDLGKASKFTKFHLTSPYLVPVPDPGVNGGATLGEHDLDLYLFDDKCKEITTHTNNLSSTVKTSTRRPARYALVNYYIGVTPDVPFTLESTV